MNFYPHHIGDFNNATRHLTRVERSLYEDCMWLYYDTEQPLQATDFEMLARKVMARSDEEKAALKVVLAEFFLLDGSVYRNFRCDAEIDFYKAKCESASNAGRASAKKRAQQKLHVHSTDLERTCEIRSTNQEPRTKNQEPITKNKNTVAAPDGVSIQVWADFLKLRKTLKAPMTDTALNGIKREAVKAGISLEQALTTCVERSWRGFDANWLQNNTKQKEFHSVLDKKRAISAELTGRNTIDMIDMEVPYVTAIESR